MEFKIYYFILKRIITPLWNSKFKTFRLLGKIFRVTLNFTFKIDIDPNASIGKKPLITHFIGIVIGPSKIGDNCTLRHNLTIGRKKVGSKGYPKIGNNVDIGCNVVILGNITIGDNAIIGAGSVVLHDVLKNTTVVGIPAKKI